MLIKNKTVAIISLPTPDGTPDLRLLPGVNEVKDSDWKFAEPSMAIHLENDRLEIVEVKVAELEQPPDEDEPTGGIVQPNTIAQLGQKKALPLIAATVDRELLKQWELEESASNRRPKVLAAIAAQLEQVKVAAADDAGADDAEEETPDEE